MSYPTSTTTPPTQPTVRSHTPHARPLFQEGPMLKGHSGVVEAVAFSPDGQYLASGSSDGTIRLWVARSGGLLRVLKCGTVESLAFGYNPLCLATAAFTTIHLWDVPSGKKAGTLKGHHNAIRDVKCPPGRAILASTSYDHTIRLWDLASRTQIAIVLLGHQVARCVVFSPDGTYLAAGVHGNLHIWNVMSSNEIMAPLTRSAPLISSIATSPNGALIASGSYRGDILLWDMESQSPIASLRAHSGRLNSLAFSPNGEVLASGGVDETVRLWDIASRSQITTLDSGLGEVYSVAFSPDGSYLAIGADDETVRVWKYDEMEVTRSPKMGNSLDIATNALQNMQPVNISSASPAEPPQTASANNNIRGYVALLNKAHIGSGGFGEVFLGRHKQLGKVAMKRLHSLLEGTSLRRFLREVDLWCKVSHRHVLLCFGTYKMGQAVYMVSPFIQNGDLMSCMKRGMVLNRAKLLHQVASALSHLHCRGIVHGDIKAQNVLLSDDGSALLCDFGLAKALDTMETSSDAKGAGSLRWMAPELINGGSRSTASDVYSFGIMISEVLSGCTPFSQFNEAATVIIQVITNNLRPPREPLISPEGESYVLLWEVAEKCWATQPNDRPHMDQVLGMLLPFARWRF